MPNIQKGVESDHNVHFYCIPLIRISYYSIQKGLPKTEIKDHFLYSEVAFQEDMLGIYLPFLTRIFSHFLMSYIY